MPKVKGKCCLFAESCQAKLKVKCCAFCKRKKCEDRCIDDVTKCKYFMDEDFDPNKED